MPFLTFSQGTFLFRSVSSLENRPSLEIRHDFCDDLESFFWVFAWIIMEHDGPGVDSVVLKRCSTVEDFCEIKVNHPSNLGRAKALYIKDVDPPSLYLTPYFSHPAYQWLHDKFRDALRNFMNPKRRRAVDLDFSPYLETTYEHVLAYFDVAMHQLQLQPEPSKSPNPRVPARIQPDRRAKRALESDGNPPPAKRPRLDLDDSTRTKARKPKPSSLQPKPKSPIPRYGRPIPSNARRSERLKKKPVLT